MTITQLEYIVALYQYGNFLEASKHCFVTQPTLSIQVKKLEEELQVVLFDRSKKPLKATEIGLKIIEQARLVLRESKRIQEILTESKNVLEGEFKLAIIPSVSAGILPLFLKSFTNKYPKIKLILSELQTAEMIEKLNNEEIDVGIASTPLEDPGILEHPLYLEPFFLFVHTDNPLNNKTSISEKDLIGQNMLLMSEGHCFRNQVGQLCKLRKDQGIYFESGNFQTLISLVKQNIGITFLPSLAIDALVKEDQKKMIKNLDGKNPCREISLIFRRKYLKEGMIKALEEEIVKSLPSSLNSNNLKSKKVIPPNI